MSLRAPDQIFDVAVVGGGPAGSSCAIVCASRGLDVVVLEREKFPREKVCGDCLNPIAWPALERLGVAEEVRCLPHAPLRSVEFVGCDHTTITIDLPQGKRAEIAVKRSDLDQLLMNRARLVGAQVHEETALTSLRLSQDGIWETETTAGLYRSRFLVAADGRNSSVARMGNRLPRARRDRVALQTHLPLPPDMIGRVRMQFVPHGYSGLADIGNNQANLCLVARPENLNQLRTWAESRYQVPRDQVWRSVTPLSRDPIAPMQDGLLLVGDAARVVEPFTGEGISYAILSGELAGHAVKSPRLAQFAKDHAALYRGRLWINHLAKFACMHPYDATRLIRAARIFPPLLSVLTRKVIGTGRAASSHKSEPLSVS